jgi:hypothetical protein
MSQTIPAQHPAVVLRSHYLHVRQLLAIATIAIVGLTIAVVILATTHSGNATIATPAASVSSLARSATTRYDGGREEGIGGPATRGPAAASQPATIRYDGGPEEGTRASDRK